MKMKRLASIINPMCEEKSHQAPSLDNEGIGDKIAGFAKFATSKKGNKGASININGFQLQSLVKKKSLQGANDRDKVVSAQSLAKEKSVQGASARDKGVSAQSLAKEKSVQGSSDRDKGVSAQSLAKEKSVQGASDRDKGVSAKSMIEAKQEIGVQNTKKRSRPASVSTEKAGFTDIEKMRRFRRPTESIPAKSAEPVLTKPASAGDEDGYAPISQAKMRRIRSPTECIPTKSAECVPTKPGQHNSTQSAERVSTKPGHQNSTQLGHRILAQSEHQNANRSGEITPTDRLKICSQFQSQQHSPVQSRQHTSHSRQSTPNQSQESRQLTPLSQSRQGTPNVSSSAANNYIYWNFGSTDNNGRTRVEVIEKVLEPSHECSSKIRHIMYEKLEPTGYKWKSISKETRDFYFEEFKK